MASVFGGRSPFQTEPWNFFFWSSQIGFLFWDGSISMKLGSASNMPIIKCGYLRRKNLAYRRWLTVVKQLDVISRPLWTAKNEFISWTLTCPGISDASRTPWLFFSFRASSQILLPLWFTTLSSKWFFVVNLIGTVKTDLRAWRLREFFQLSVHYPCILLQMPISVPLPNFPLHIF